MRVLLDTHTLIWAFDDPRSGKRAIRLDRFGREIGIKVGLGKLSESHGAPAESSGLIAST
jgi:hypothetical protein